MKNSPAQAISVCAAASNLNKTDFVFVDYNVLSVFFFCCLGRFKPLNWESVSNELCKTRKSSAESYINFDTWNMN